MTYLFYEKMMAITFAFNLLWSPSYLNSAFLAYRSTRSVLQAVFPTSPQPNEISLIWSAHDEFVSLFLDHPSLQPVLALSQCIRCCLKSTIKHQPSTVRLCLRDSKTRFSAIFLSLPWPQAHSVIMFPGEFFSILRAADPLDWIPRRFLFHKFYFI